MRFLILFLSFNFIYTVKGQDVSVWKDSTTLLNSINIIISDDSLSQNLKLNLIYKFLEKNKPFDVDSLNFNQLTNAPDDIPSLLNSLKQNNTEDSKETTKKKQCQGKTKKGARCSRNAQKGSKFCWQHEK